MTSRVSASIGACCIAVLFGLPTARATTINIGAPYNVLSGSIVTSSTVTSSSFHSGLTVDDAVRAVPPADQDHGLIFASFDSDQRLGMTGNYGLLRKLRIWTIPVEADERIPSSVTLRSSLNALGGFSLVTPGSYETSLGTFPLGISAFSGIAAGTDNRYATLSINAPAGTQSLYFSFGAADFKGERISEVQAFIPEPSNVMLLGATLFGFMDWRRRRF